MKDQALPTQKQWIAILDYGSQYTQLIARRIRNEEKVLETGLPGYAEYKTRVRWRLLPYIW